jgi:hypothetical protein
MPFNPDAAIQAVGFVASLAELGTFSGSLLKWIIGNRGGAPLTVEEFERWASANDGELHDFVEKHRSEVESAIQLVKDSVFQAILEHELNSQKRHEQLLKIAEEFSKLDTPRLSIYCIDFRVLQNGPNWFARAKFHIVNQSRLHTTLIGAGGIVSDEEKETPMQFSHGSWPNLRHELPVNGGAAEIIGETAFSVFKGGPVLREFQVRVMQCPQPLVYEPIGSHVPMEMKLR